MRLRDKPTKSEKFKTMKTSIKTLFESAIRDNKENIVNYSEDGNIYEYFAGNIQADKSAMNWYLSDEEIAFVESHDEDECSDIFDAVWDFLEKYNMTITEFLDN